MRFIILLSKRYHIGQGLITYGKEEVVNWITTLADSMRSASDLGSLRFSLKTFHKPTYSFKGSFIVCQALTERTVSFDNGIKGSIAEDAYFVVRAVSLGYTFDWIEGEMLEKSPFTFWDFVKQRKRWVQGLYLLVHDSQLKTNFTKLGFIFSFINWILVPIQILNSLILIAYPISFSWVDELLSRVNFIVFIYMLFVGVLKSVNLRRRRLIQNFTCLIGMLVAMPFIAISESIAILWGVFSEKNEFFVVKKNELISIV